MAITVSFSSGSKRENSTKQLTMTATHYCTFKNGCDMLNPTLLLELDLDTFPTYTAFQIESRYYNVTNIRSVRDNLFEISGSIDVLATYKSNIQATTAYVIYDSIANTELPDNRLPMKTTAVVHEEHTDCPLDYEGGGMYILSLTGSHKSTGIYKVSLTELNELIDDIQSVTDNIFDPTIVEPTPPSASSNVWEWLKYTGEAFMYAFKKLTLPITQFFSTGNIPENIRECRYIPFDVGTAMTYVDPVYLGSFQTSKSLYQISSETEYERAEVDIPWHTNDYRRRSPYTELYLYLPYIGMVKLSSENLIDQTKLKITYAIAIRNGDIVVTVFSGDDKEVIGQYAGNVSVEVPVGFSNISLPKAGQAVISGLVNASNGNLGGVGMAALSFGESVAPNFSCIGGLDGIATVATKQEIVCYSVFHDTIVAPNTELATIGSPTMKPRLLDYTNPTFVQTKAASVSGAMTSDERNKINAFLDSGIYIE